MSTLSLSYVSVPLPGFSIEKALLINFKSSCLEKFQSRCRDSVLRKAPNAIPAAGLANSSFSPVAGIQY